MTTDPSTDEDAKLVTLARAARSRLGATEGAAVRDALGRTYAAATVTLPSLRLTALQAAVAAAASSGAADLEAGCIVTDAPALSSGDRALADELGIRTLLLAGADGTVRPE